ncbi:MAG: hypothetical protein NC818_02350 [Candidatus Omnitrophica bacterium]|nr:hypothetical protein [Candidatus Omnitrophota bacterium]
MIKDILVIFLGLLILGIVLFSLRLVKAKRNYEFITDLFNQLDIDNGEKEPDKVHQKFTKMQPCCKGGSVEFPKRKEVRDKQKRWEFSYKARKYLLNERRRVK